MQHWLLTKPVGSGLAFIADDYNQEEDGSWVIYGRIDKAPPFVNAALSLNKKWSEEQIIELCDTYNMEIAVTLKSYTIDHKKQIYQVDTEMIDESLYLDAEAASANDDAFATVTID